MAIDIAIVEDDLSARKIFGSWIDREDGFRLVSQQGDAESALETLPEVRPAVVLMDIHLPR